jgi:hypothetical protein
MIELVKGCPHLISPYGVCDTESVVKRTASKQTRDKRRHWSQILKDRVTSTCYTEFKQRVFTVARVFDLLVTAWVCCGLMPADCPPWVSIWHNCVRNNSRGLRSSYGFRLIRNMKLKTKTKLCGLSQRANYTDRATAALSTNLVPTFVDKECRVVSATDPYGRILDFLDRSRYFFLPSSSSIDLLVSLMELPNNRRLRRHLPNDLPTRFLV